MTRTQNENSSMNIEGQDKQKSGDNTQLTEMEEVKDSPFTIVRYDELWFLTMGKYRLSEPVKTKEEVLEMTQDTTWNRIVQVMKIMIDETLAMHEKEKNEQLTAKKSQVIHSNH